MTKEKRCDCKVNCCLHVYADDMLRMLYRCASECAECEGEGQVIAQCIQRDVDRWDETMGPCPECADIRELIQRCDPCGDLLIRAPANLPEPEPEDGIAF